MATSDTPPPAPGIAPSHAAAARAAGPASEGLPSGGAASRLPASFVCRCAACGHRIVDDAMPCAECGVEKPVWTITGRSAPRRFLRRPPDAPPGVPSPSVGASHPPSASATVDGCPAPPHGRPAPPPPALRPQQPLLADVDWLFRPLAASLFALVLGSMGVQAVMTGTAVGQVAGSVLLLAALGVVYLAVMFLRARLDRRQGTLAWEIDHDAVRIISPHPAWPLRTLRDVHRADVAASDRPNALIIALRWAPRLGIDCAIEVDVGDVADPTTARRDVEALFRRILARGGAPG